MKITRVESFILHVPVTGNGIADSTHSITHWGVVGGGDYARPEQPGAGTIPTDGALARFGIVERSS